jgi:hypothetical protein
MDEGRGGVVVWRPVVRRASEGNGLLVISMFVSFVRDTNLTQLASDHISTSPCGDNKSRKSQQFYYKHGLEGSVVWGDRHQRWN